MAKSLKARLTTKTIHKLTELFSELRLDVTYCHVTTLLLFSFSIAEKAHSLL